MKIERTKNATRNISTGTFEKVHQFIFAFLIRTVMIHYLGAEYLGLNSLFTSLLQVLNLAELGVGSAMGFSMYKPIADDNTNEICALLKLYRTYYRVIGIVILVVGLLLLPFLRNLIADVESIPSELNLYILYLLNLGATVLSYWLYSYMGSLLSAHQRNDVNSKIVIQISTIKYLTQFVAIIFFKSYYAFLIITLLLRIVQNIYTAQIVRKMYPLYLPKGDISPEVQKNINQRIKDLFTTKLGSVITNSADSIVISAVLGLTVVAIYNNYYYIITGIMSFMLVIFASCTAGIGNSLVVETVEKNYNDFKKFTFLITWLSGVCVCCFLNLFQPFMMVWMGDSLLLEYQCVICICINFYILEVNQLFIVYKDAAGIWHEDRFRAFITAIVNIVFSIVFAKFWGILGILLATLLSNLFVGFPWLMQNLFSLVFKKNIGEYVKSLFKQSFAVFIGAVISFLICNSFTFDINYVTIALNLIVSIIVPCIVYVVCFHASTEYFEIKQMAFNILRRIFKSK